MATYAGLRSLPVEPCEFLHYGEFINAEGVLEGCGYEETGFFRMDEIRFPIRAEITPLDDAVAGQSVTLKLTLFTSTGRPIRWEDIAVSHTERIHALVVDPGLGDYQHLHPQPAGPEGHYLMEMTPRHGGRYNVYLDFIPLINSRRTLLATSLDVAGTAAAPQPAHRMEHQQGELHFSMQLLEGGLVAGQEARVQLEVSHSSGRSLTFSTVMDAYAHLVAFDQHGSGFAHLHPLNPFTAGQDPADPELEFAFMFDRPGYYRVWSQMIIDGEEVFVPFDLQIKDGTPALAALN